MDTLNDRHQIFSPYSSICADCMYFNSIAFNCQAFPAGIPDEYLSGDDSHTEVVKGQVGTTVFTQEKE